MAPEGSKQRETLPETYWDTVFVEGRLAADLKPVWRVTREFRLHEEAGSNAAHKSGHLLAARQKQTARIP